MSVQGGRRILEGIASTPTLDHLGDKIDPTGAVYSLPLPLLWQHRHQDPIGQVTRADVRPEGIAVRCELPIIEDPGPLKSTVDKAWQAVKTGLVRGLSIGFTPLQAKPLPSGGQHFTSWRWHELSIVTISANAEAAITGMA